MIIIHTKAPKSKSKKKARGPIAQKLDITKLYKYNTDLTKTYNYCPRPAAERARAVQSRVTTTQFIPARKSMTDPMTLAKESKEVQDAIIAKSKRLAPAYNKGAIQYITDDAEIQTLGRKIK
jgi:hypothetical protein